jgi:hypothetical protein
MFGSWKERRISHKYFHFEDGLVDQDMTVIVILVDALQHVYLGSDVVILGTKEDVGSRLRLLLGRSSGLLITVPPTATSVCRF